MGRTSLGAFSLEYLDTSSEVCHLVGEELDLSRGAGQSALMLAQKHPLLGHGRPDGIRTCCVHLGRFVLSG